MNGCRDAAEAGLARVVEPTQAEVVHPPNLRSGCYRDVNADGVEVLEGVVQVDGSECAVAESGAGIDGDALGGDGGGVAGGLVESEPSEREDARRAVGVAAECSTVHVEAEATCEAMITIANVSRIAVL